MTYDNPKGGIGYAAEFQSSALPFVTTSQAPLYTSGVQRHDFPKVSRFITLINHSGAGQHLRVGFTQNGVTLNGNYFMIDGGQHLTVEMRVKQLFVAGDSASVTYSLCAGLTNISKDSMPLLTGTLPDGSSGWSGVG